MLITLAYSVAGGMLTILAAAKIRLIAWRFLRLMGMLTLALAVVPTVWRLHESGWNPQAIDRITTLGLFSSASAAILLTLAPVSARRPAMIRLVCLLGGVSGIVAAVYSCLSITNHLPPTFLLVGLITINQVLSSLFLGSITLAWLLGHAYLTATKMTIAPLRRFSRLFTIATSLRILFVIGSIALGCWTTRHGAPTLSAMLWQSWLITAVRLGVGLVAVEIFAYMVADCVRLRSTQSATGILFFGSIFAYVGELAGQHLLYETGWPI